jgi:ribosomal protein S18 acetylase RimI-like enzyme
VNQIRLLEVNYSNEIHNMILSHQELLQDKAMLNWNRDSIVEILKTEKAFGLVCVNEKTSKSELLAFVIYRDLINIAEILLLGTLVKRQSQGLMRTLFSSLKKDYPEIWLEVHELNTKACKLYEKENFKLDGIRPKYYTDGKSALVMSWKRGLAI